VEGFDRLQLPREVIPTIAYLNGKIEPATGWQTVRTRVRYSDAVDWYKEFAQRHFLVTDYIREEHELEFTPEPDMFHDIFGHLPFLMIPEYAEFEDLFAPTFLRADEETREQIKRLAWYTAEFGMVRENGELKVFGAGLLSSAGEIDKVMSGGTRLEEFSIQKIIEVPKSVWEFNSVLFVADSLEHFSTELRDHFARI
jgi:phenylalanine-4-hydroxylase